MIQNKIVILEMTECYIFSSKKYAAEKQTNYSLPLKSNRYFRCIIKQNVVYSAPAIGIWHVQ